jgi:hypothetical protein
VHTTKVCAHPTPGPRKAGPSLDGGVLSVWVPTASRNSACARRNKGTTRLQGKGARAATTAAAPAKRPARLDGRLSSDGGSARRRGAGQRATLKQRAHKARSSLGSKAGSTTKSRGFLTSRSGHGGDEQRNGLEQRKQGGAVHGFHGGIFPVLQPRSLAFRRGGVEELGEEETDRGGVVLGGSSPGLTTTTALGAAAGWWRRGAQPKSRGSARCGSRPKRLRLGRRRPWLGLLRLHSGQARDPLLRRPRLQAGGDVGVRRRGDPDSSTGGLQRSSSPPPPSSPLLLSSCGGQGGTPWGGGTVQGDAGGGGFIGWRPRVWGRGSGRLGFLGFRAPSHAAASGGGRGRARCGARRLLARHPYVTVGIGRGRGKGEGKGELTGGPHMAVKQGEVEGRRAGWLSWAKRVDGPRGWAAAW